MRGRVGNDVVDLGDPQIAEHHTRARFIDRVCTHEEARRARGDKLALWSLFAAKEAAYKVLVKLGCRVGFAHRDIVVDEAWRTVVFGDVRLDLRIESGDEHVHAVASIDAAPISVVRRTTDDDLSRASRALLGEVLARDGVRAELEIVRDPIVGAWDGYGPPRVVSAGVPLDVDVSLSHDGRFVACASSRIASSTLRLTAT